MEKAVLWDLYGTLIDIHTDEESNRFWQRFAKKMCRIKAYDPTDLKQIYQKYCRLAEEEKEEIDVLPVFQALFDIDEKQASKVCWLFRRLSTSYIRLYPGVLKLLKKLKKQGIALYVLSNAQASFTMPELEKLKIKRFFNGIALSSDYGIKKPNKNYYEQALQTFGLNDQEIWMIGNDYECDVKPARLLGLNSIFIESNLTPPCDQHSTMKNFQAKAIYKQIVINSEPFGF